MNRAKQILLNEKNKYIGNLEKVSKVKRCDVNIIDILVFEVSTDRLTDIDKEIDEMGYWNE